MKKPLFFIFLLVCTTCALLACTKKNSSALEVDKPSDGQAQKVEPAKIDLEQTTLQHKTEAYIKMTKAGGLDAYFDKFGDDEIVLDLDKFLGDLGLKYTVENGKIRIVPNVEYAPADDFEYVILYEGDMIHGNSTFIGRTDDGWKKNDGYNSATDFIFLMSLNKQVYNIGCDELDVMYRSLRVLTTPAEKVDEVNAAIDAELAWSDEPIEFEG